jgi:hypothetical protein
MQPWSMNMLYRLSPLETANQVFTPSLALSDPEDKGGRYKARQDGTRQGK